MANLNEIKDLLKQSAALKQKLAADESFVQAVADCAALIVETLKGGGKVILFGNGGSAADSQHIAAELVGRFTRERKGFAALALSCNSSNLTCIGNDYGFEQIFSRQLEALGKAQDIAIGLSTSGSSKNVIAGINKAKSLGMKTVVLLGKERTELSQAADLVIQVAGENTARIQETHITIGHILCGLVEKALS